MRLRRLLFLFVLLFGLAPLANAEDEPSAAQTELKQLVERQKNLLTRAGRLEEDDEDMDELKRQMQDLCWDYDQYLKKYPDVAAGYTAYASFLNRTDMRREAIAMYLKSNKLDPNQALVKNQLGNYLAETGKPLEAINYYIAAQKLEPREPLYHYQIGLLLAEASDLFVKSGEWTRAAIDRSMLKAFKTAAELAPDRVEFAYRYCEAFSDVESPDWPAALNAWDELEQRQPPGFSQELIRLHKARIHILQNRFEEAQRLIESVSDARLEKQKEKLIALLSETRKK